MPYFFLMIEKLYLKYNKYFYLNLLLFHIQNILVGIYCHQNGHGTMDTKVVKEHWDIISGVLYELGKKYKYISADGDVRVRSAFLE